ncbi:hypothetical protein ACN38_g10520 [Penicillium nordicum]|uniref:Uncharacterized protein n=1 Tax=Penicillium nordicum TaxID=229535 RepID=A0A0M8P1F0_9EURO|nr:hypothetical protein ACN38_g10520 [Penicillium nordicum]
MQLDLVLTEESTHLSNTKNLSISQDFWGPMIIFVYGSSYARMTSLVPPCMWLLKKFPGVLIDTIGCLFLFSYDVLVEVDMQYA